MHVTRSAPILLFLCSVLTGCFQMDYVITLDEDLSGTADFTLVMDMEEMAVTIASLQKSFMGDASPPTAAEIAEVRSRMREEMDLEGMDVEEMRSGMRHGLPQGVDVVNVTRQQEGMRMQVDVAFTFDDLRNLVDLNLQPGQQQMPTDARPFGDLIVVEEGRTITIRSGAINPAAEMREEMGAMLTETVIANMFGDMRSTISIAAPFEIVEHNATERVGNRLTWVYTFETLRTGVIENILVRYRR